MIGPRCIHCKKQRDHHRASNMACPVGKRNRELGFTQFHAENRFEAKEPARGGASEKRKDRATRRATKAEPCCACGTRGTDWNPVDPAHIRTFKVTQSDHPAGMIPLCRQCHRTQHQDGWGIFLRQNPDVVDRLESMGWRIHEDPFHVGRVILSHPEVA